MGAPYDDREQTEVKHQVLTRYLKAFVPIVGDWASDIAYIDCLAGPWESKDPTFRDTSFGRAIEVLRSTRNVLEKRGKHPHLRCLFIEQNPDAFAQLKKYCDAITDVQVKARHWDFTKHISDILRFAKERANSFPFIFIDPTGWELVEPELIAPILNLERNEVLITLMTSWIVRFIGDDTKGFARLLGPDLDRLRQLAGEAQEEEIVKSYAASVRAAGKYTYVCTLPILKPDQDSFHFYMVYGTRHPRGIEVFKQTEASVYDFMHETRAKAQERRRLEKSGQTEMFGAQARYRESRFTRFQARSRTAAKAEVQAMLESKGRVPYDDVWLTAMGYSGVLGSDLHKWIEEWRAAGLLSISNQPETQRTPRKNQNQLLIWRKRPL